MLLFLKQFIFISNDSDQLINIFITYICQVRVADLERNSIYDLVGVWCHLLFVWTVEMSVVNPEVHQPQVRCLIILSVISIHSVTVAKPPFGQAHQTRPLFVLSVRCGLNDLPTQINHEADWSFWCDCCKMRFQQSYYGHGYVKLITFDCGDNFYLCKDCHAVENIATPNRNFRSKDADFPEQPVSGF